MQTEWRTVVLILACYGLWVLAGAVLWQNENVALQALALALMTVMAALHGSLVHEALHGHPTKNRLVNEALVIMNLSLLYPYRRYKATHLRHHRDARLTDPFDDPESWYHARWRHEAMPGAVRLLLRVNNTMLGRIVVGPWLGAFGFVAGEWRMLRTRGLAHLRLAWGLHLAGLVPVLAAIWWFGIPLWLYALTVVWGSFALTAIRTYAEHQWHETPGGRTIIVERSPLAWLFLNNNLHVVHHRLPRVAWYDLPKVYRADPAAWRVVNQGYVVPNYWHLFRNHALRGKEPVVHPVLHQTPLDRV